MTTYDLQMENLEENMMAIFNHDDFVYTKNTILRLLDEFRFSLRGKIRIPSGTYYLCNKDYLKEREEISKKKQKRGVEWQAVTYYNGFNIVCEKCKSKGLLVRNLFTLADFIDYYEMYLYPKKPNGHTHLTRINKNDDFRPGNIIWVENRKRKERREVFHDIRNMYVMAYIHKYFAVRAIDLFNISVRKGFISRYANINSFKVTLSKQKVNV